MRYNTITIKRSHIILGEGKKRFKATTRYCKNYNNKFQRVNKNLVFVLNLSLHQFID
jgi:hypothetical protein